MSLAQGDHLSHIDATSLRLGELLETRSSIRVHGTPFFKDSGGFTCSANPDQLLKAKHFEFDAALLPKVIKCKFLLSPFQRERSGRSVAPY